MYFVYFIQSAKDKSVYVGSTQDVNKRLQEHNSGKTKSTKSKLPYKLVYIEEFQTKKEALVRELKIKRSWNEKEKILKIINKDLNI